MLVYKCDACGELISDPYELKMKEFCVEVECDSCGVFPVKRKRKVEVHLCEECYTGLFMIAEGKTSKESESTDG